MRYFVVVLFAILHVVINVHEVRGDARDESISYQRKKPASTTCSLCGIGEDQCQKACGNELTCKESRQYNCEWDYKTESGQTIPGCHRVYKFENPESGKTHYTAYNCYCSSKAVTYKAPCTDSQLNLWDKDCTNPFRVGPCDDSVNNCYFDCIGRCVYDYKDNGVEKTGPCKPKKTCFVSECDEFVDVRNLHTRPESACKSKDCSGCKSCNYCEEKDGKRVWGKCENEKRCGVSFCVSKSDTFERTPCFKYETCPETEECNKSECETSNCAPCELQSKAQIAADGDKGKCKLDCDDVCVSHYYFEGDESKILHARKCRKKKQSETPCKYPKKVPNKGPNGGQETTKDPNDGQKTTKDPDDGNNQNEDNGTGPDEEDWRTPIDWERAQYYCRWKYNSDLATIKTQEDLITALEIIGDEASSCWIGLRSTHNGGFFNFVDKSECSPEHNGRDSGVCAEPSLFADGHPVKCTDGGQMCVRIDVVNGVIVNDIHCEDELPCLLCNCPNSADGPWIGPYPK